MYHRLWAIIWAALLLIGPSTFAQTDTLARMDAVLSRHVNDYANIISPDVETQLESELDAFVKETDHTIVVATTPSLDGMHEQQFANELFAKWKIGRADIDNGLLILVAPVERTMWIEVGYGLEGVVTDLIASSIARNIMAPAFKQENYDGGLIEGVRAIQDAARGELVLPEKKFYQNDLFIILSIMIGITLIIGGVLITFVIDNRKRIWPSVATGSVAGVLDGLTVLILNGMLVYAVLTVMTFTLLAYLLARWLQKIKFDPTKYRTSGNSWTSGSGSSDGDSFSGHSGGSSGGGGGGAKW